MTKIYYEEIYADQKINEFIEKFWFSKNITREALNYTILPDGYFDLIMEVSDSNFINPTLFGLWTKQADIIITAGSIYFGICFKPLASEYLFGNSIKTILNNYQSLPDNFWEIDEMSFEDFLKATEHFSKKIVEIIENNKTMDSRKQNTFKLIFESGGALPIQDLSNQVFWNCRQINRYFNDRLGLSVKAYCNIIRCAEYYSDIRDGKLNPKQEYYDQSHFIKEIKKHTGQNPSKLHENKNDRILQFITLPKK